MGKSIGPRQHQVLISLLRDARIAAGLTQAQAARALGKPQSFVAKYENGERRIDVVEFLTLADALKADAVALLRRLIAADR